MKLVREVGCNDNRQHGNHLEFLTGKADRVFDSMCAYGQRGQMSSEVSCHASERWSDTWKGMTSSGLTSRLIVSFPKDIDSREEQVITARFCERFFEGQLDCIASTHSDRAHRCCDKTRSSDFA